MGGGAQSPDFPACFASRKTVEQSPVQEVDERELTGAGLIADRIDARGMKNVKGALEKVYPLSSGSVGLLSSHKETKAFFPGESSVSRGAMQSFRLLKEHPAVQTVFTSIACDPNVLNAIMQNPDLMKLIETDKKCAQFMGQGYQNSSFGFCELEKPSDGFTGFIKQTMQNAVKGLSNLSQRFFPEANTEEKSEYSDGTLFTASTVMALVMMVITMVVLKRP